ncbi:hypothetical protein QP445_15290, partial [Micrococcus luteus]|nr:hypothetical protein [Micrococcus luteus]
EHTAVAVIPHLPAGPLVVMIFTAAQIEDMASRKASCDGVNSTLVIFSSIELTLKLHLGQQGSALTFSLLLTKAE